MDPYKVLGVSETASDEEVRAAYLKLVKKYHPDRYQDNPLKNLATEKLKEINQAYDTITKMRENGGNKHDSSSYSSSSYSYDYNSYNTGSSYSGQYHAEFSRVRQSLNSNNLNEAAAILNGIPLHNAEWNYLYGLIYFRMGNFSTAHQYLSQAVNMEPNNSEYRRAYESLMSRGSRSYHSYGNMQNDSDSCNSTCNICGTLWCMDSCCECMGGDLIRCC